MKDENNLKLQKPPYFQGLRWKMMLFFVLLVYCLFAFMGIFGGILEYTFLRIEFASIIKNDSSQNRWSNLDLGDSFEKERKTLKEDSKELLSWLESNPESVDPIRIWLKAYKDKLKQNRKNDFEVTYHFFEYFDSENTPLIEMIAFNSSGKVIATSAGKKIPIQISSNEREFVNHFLNNKKNEKKEYDGQHIPHLQYAFLIKNTRNETKGGLLFRERLPFQWSQAFYNSIYWAADRPTSDIVFFGILGLIFGSPFAWYLSKRLENIAQVTHSWQTGDFSLRTEDNSPDEIGILSRRLDEMAADLKETLELKQIVATSEERNRIARDLHDSVKQQVFGLAMQLSTAKTLVEKDKEKTKTHLQNATDLVGQIQKELTDLIFELSPLDNETIDIVKKIDSFGNDWSRRNNIEFELISDEIPKLKNVPARSLYRITQEALSNIVRHSKATKAIVKIDYNATQLISLSVSDNGIGFNINEIQKGFGLENIRTRTEQLPQGSFTLSSLANQGTTLKIEFLHQKKQEN